MNLGPFEQAILKLWNVNRFNTRQITIALNAQQPSVLYHESDIHRMLRDIWDRQYTAANAKHREAV